MTAKKRVDLALVERGLCESREKAQRAIMAGEVYRREVRVNKPSETVEDTEELSVRAPAIPYVGRGGLKLEKALKVFSESMQDHVVMDVGCATGGFTDVCLQNGARHVYAIDVGYGQFDWKLRSDARVTLMERTNARTLTRDMFPLLPDRAVMDVSFISITLILPVLFSIMGEGGVALCLIKPQFEAGRGKVGKNGVVREARVHEEVIRNVRAFCLSCGLSINALDFSPITGPKGNIEFLARIIRGCEECIDEAAIHEVVSAAHETLRRGQLPSGAAQP